MRAALLASALLPACGYAILRGDRPFGAAHVMLVPFREDMPVGLSPVLSEELAARLAAQGVRLVLDESRADAVLSGDVLSETWRLSPGASAQAYQVTLRIRASLKSKDGASLWEGEAVVSDDFLTAVGIGELDLLATESNRRRALFRIAAQAATELCDQMIMSAAGGAS